MSESLDRQKLWSEVREIRNTTGLGLREANDARIRYGSAKAAIEALALPVNRDAYESEYDRLRRTNRELLEALEAIVKSRDENCFKQEEFHQGGLGNYWSPHASMVNSEVIAKARAVIAKATGSIK